MSARSTSTKDLPTRRFVESSPYLETADAREATPDNIVIFVPGIRTNADWIDEASNEIEYFTSRITDIKILKTGCGRISTFHLFSRFGLRKFRNEIEEQIVDTIDRHNGSRISLVCHSMGTDLVLNYLRNHDFRFNYIIFLGGICHRRHAKILKNRARVVINHRGTYDKYPLLASIFNFLKYSPTGTFGFNKAIYINDIISQNDHFSCTEKDYVLNVVLPVICDQGQFQFRNVVSPISINMYHYCKFSSYFLLLSCLALVQYSIVISILCFFLSISLPFIAFSYKTRKVGQAAFP